MKIIITLKYGGFILAVFSIIIAGSIDATAQVENTTINELSSALSGEKYAAPATVFGGVGRKYPTWQAGLDLLILSSPHYKAFRNQFELSDRVVWGEWWYSDGLGVKALYSEQSFTMFGESGNGPQAKTSHLGFLTKIQQTLVKPWKMSAGLGLAKTEFVLENQIKLGNSLISELRIGFELLANFWTEVGILTIDSSSGGGSGDQRLGSTGYLFGFSYGF